MARIIWTDRALTDIEAIADYIALDSIRYAKLVVQQLFGKTEVLKTFPLSGRMVPELQNTNLRELLEGEFRIIYEVHEENTIFILTVHHTARLLRPTQL
jgi:toxin ParE1/3/4